MQVEEFHSTIKFLYTNSIHEFLALSISGDGAYMVTLQDTVIKIAIVFEHLTATENQITNYFVNTVRPNLDVVLTNKMDANFDPGWTKGYSFFIQKQNDGVTWEVYPKIWIAGTTSLSGNALKTGVSNILKDLKVRLKTDMIAQGAFNLKFHVHYEDGRAAEGDEF